MSAHDAEVFRKAAAVLERDGWVQGDFHHPQHGHCALGALEIALWGRPYSLSLNDPAEMDDLRRVRDLLGTHVGDFVTDWNDGTGRTQGDVVKALLQVADLEDVAEDGT